MYPGKLEEQPMPLMVTTLWFGMRSSTSAFCTAASTPKSPQPGHQSGSTLPFMSAMVNCLALSTLVAICVSSSDHDLVRGNGEFRLPRELFLHRLHDVMRHEGFAVVFTDVALRHETGFTSQIARKLGAVVVLNDDRVPRALQNFENRLAMQGHQPADLELIGRNALLAKNLAALLDHAHGRTPTDQSNIGIARTAQRGRRDDGLDAGHLAHALFHHGPALDRIGELVADQHARSEERRV